MGCPFNILSNHMQGQAWGAAKALFCRNIMEACEAGSMEVSQRENIKWKE
jgi:hypothetical protein